MPTSEQPAACYVYGIVPADVELTSDARGLADRPVDVVRQGDVAALVSEVDPVVPLGRPADLMAHQRLLDDAARDVPVLPMRFGAVMTDARAVVRELLAPNEAGFRAALAELEGRVEYVVRGRYVERAVLTEVVGENAAAARLREQIRGRGEKEAYEARVRLGELLYRAVEAKRETDTGRLIETVSPYCVLSAVREPTHHLDAAHVAFLVDSARRSEFEDAVGKVGREWEERADLRLQGPIAPYDFVLTPGG
ncbi:gas vesicle protein GvpFL [Actinomadura craniellae]|uniref:Gas vesicle protein GvpFL n=1 Tax=Actinomadura craniellae TaxID=2231787 RepID=A0A365H3M0_9ACTN|nr:GvpL/GvpF family gas vesicle protein [Actinomadura craniellae]RAY13618.1 gas vesicle protein GvpFL [Actinomadura craniellae]